MKLGRTNARLSRKLSNRSELIASKTTEKMDQEKEVMEITVPNPLARQFPTWSQMTSSASTTLKICCQPANGKKYHEQCRYGKRDMYNDQDSTNQIKTSSDLNQ